MVMGGVWIIDRKNKKVGRKVGGRRGKEYEREKGGKIGFC